MVIYGRHNKYISNKKSINKEINKDSQLNKINNEKSEEEDEEEIDTKIFNGLLGEDKKLNTNNSNNINDKVTTKENKNSRNFDTFIEENNNLIDLNFISFGDVNSLYNFQNGKMDTINKKNDSKSKNNIIQNNKLSPINNKLILNNSVNKLKNGLEEKSNSPSTQKNRRKNSNGSLLNNNDSNSKEKNNEDNAIFLNKQMIKINNLFEGLNIKKNKDKNNNRNEEMDIVRNYWESRTFFKISEINKGNAILVSADDNIINFPAFLLPKGVKIGEIYNFEIKSMDKGFIFKNQKANEIDDIQKKFLNSE